MQRFFLILNLVVRKETARLEKVQPVLALQSYFFNIILSSRTCLGLQSWFHFFGFPYQNLVSLPRRATYANHNVTTPNFI